MVVLALGIHLFSLHSEWVERYYSNGLYPFIGMYLRLLSGWFSFSIGDVLYGIAGGWVLYKIITLRKWFRKRKGEKPIQILLISILKYALEIYIAFNILWGLNYNRMGIGHQLGLEIPSYTTEELIRVNEILLEKANHYKSLSLQTPEPDWKTMRKQVYEAYNKYTKTNGSAQLKYSSMKKSIWSWLGNASGFTGYYNPFTGEAQVNSTVPKFLQPSIAMHEAGHQLGYAKEDEANFVAFLSVRETSSMHLRYSGYLDMFLYANRNLHYADSVAAKEIRLRLNEDVQKDLLEYKAFREKHRSVLAPLFSKIYGWYLRQNQQPTGMYTYDEVTSWIVAFYRSYGTI